MAPAICRGEDLLALLAQLSLRPDVPVERHGPDRWPTTPARRRHSQSPPTRPLPDVGESKTEQPNAQNRHFVDSRSEAGRVRARRRDRVSSGLPTFGEVACAASSPRWRRAQWGAGPRHRPAESSCRRCPRDPAARWSPLTLAGIGGSSDKQLLQVIDRGPHLLSVPRRPVVAPRQPRHAVVAACGDQPDRQTLRAVLLRTRPGTAASMSSFTREAQLRPDELGAGAGSFTIPPLHAGKTLSM